MAFQTIRVEPEGDDSGRVVTVTLDRPEVHNAIDHRMIQELSAALADIAADESIRAVVFTGAGEKAFASGVDIAELKQRGAPDALRRINAGLFRRVEELPLPTIAAIRGYALGGGCELAMACDIRIAGEHSRLGLPEVGLGIIPGAGGIQRLPRLVGMGRAKELIFTGRILKAAEAERIGLVNHVVADDEVLGEAKAVAWRIASQGPLAVRIAKEALGAAWGPNPAFDTLDVFGQAVLFESADKHERMAAFLDERAKKQQAKEKDEEGQES